MGCCGRGSAQIARHSRVDAEAYEGVRGQYVIDRAAMAKMRHDDILMHPLPRVGEIATEVDADPRSVYFKQVETGLRIRMALLEGLLR